MDDNARRILARLCAADFSRAYCQGNSLKTRLERRGTVYNVKHMNAVEKAAYMVQLYRDNPPLFAYAVKRWQYHRYEPGTPTADFINVCADWCNENLTENKVS